MTIEKCFFCDKIIVPFRYVTMQEVSEFYKQNKMDFNLNHSRSRFKIGNKIVCLSCEENIREIVIINQKKVCEICKKDDEKGVYET